MSKYTTEVRFICESFSGLEESKGFNSVNDVLANSWNKIFTTDCEFFDEEYRSVICQKILKHYYLREICCETVGIWLLWVNTRLEEIMPYYNQLYESARLDFNPLYDVDYKKSYTKTGSGANEKNEENTENLTGTTNVSESSEISGASSGTNKRTNTDETNKNYTGNSSNNKTDLYSDTPQGGITGLEENTYLTNARIVSESSNATSSDSASSSGEENVTYSDTNSGTNSKTGESSVNNTRTGKNKTTGSNSTTEEYIESISGKIGGKSYAKMIREYRETLINIDMMVIDEFSDLFFGLW